MNLTLSAAEIDGAAPARLFAHPLSANVDFKKVVHLLEDWGQRWIISPAIESV
jgi:hypothetical protein